MSGKSQRRISDPDDFIGRGRPENCSFGSRPGRWSHKWPGDALGPFPFCAVRQSRPKPHRVCAQRPALDPRNRPAAKASFRHHTKDQLTKRGVFT